jgi:hypothetical protein
MRLINIARTPARCHSGTSSGACGNTARKPIAKVTELISRMPR